MIAFKHLAKKAGLEITDEIHFFAELLAEECAEIADNAYEVSLPAGPIIRRHYNLIESNKKKG